MCFYTTIPLLNGEYTKNKFRNHMIVHRCVKPLQTKSFRLTASSKNLYSDLFNKVFKNLYSHISKANITFSKWKARWMLYNYKTTSESQ